MPSYGFSHGGGGGGGNTATRYFESGLGTRGISVTATPTSPCPAHPWGRYDNGVPRIPGLHYTGDVYDMNDPAPRHPSYHRYEGRVQQSRYSFW